jgi:hypothetical protein
MQRVTLKTSTIFISKGDRTRIFRSVGEIPEPLRRELEEAHNSFNSETILIADRRGREELRRELNGLPTPLRTRLGRSLDPPAAEPATPVPTHEPRRFPQPQRWWALAVPIGMALAAWAATRLQ